LLEILPYSEDAMARLRIEMELAGGRVEVERTITLPDDTTEEQVAPAVLAGLRTVEHALRQQEDVEMDSATRAAISRLVWDMSDRPRELLRLVANHEEVDNEMFLRTIGEEGSRFFPAALGAITRHARKMGLGNILKTTTSKGRVVAFATPPVRDALRAAFERKSESGG
jgi:hypothetical protein